MKYHIGNVHIDKTVRRNAIFIGIKTTLKKPPNSIYLEVSYGQLPFVNRKEKNRSADQFHTHWLRTHAHANQWHK